MSPSPASGGLDGLLAVELGGQTNENASAATTKQVLAVCHDISKTEPDLS